MGIREEQRLFDESNLFLEARIKALAKVDAPNATREDIFVAEAVAFRVYRGYERFARALFLHSCATTRTPNGQRIISKLKCADWSTTERILKAGNRFLNWGKPEATKKLAELVFQNGFPISDVISPVHSTLVDLQRIRNFIAHDSSEARSGFDKAGQKYLRTGSPLPDSAGLLLLSRKYPRRAQAIRQIFRKVSALSKIYSQL